MSLAIRFHRAARAEFIEAAARYEAQQKNLGVEFITEIERCVTLAAEQPMIFATVHKDIRRVTAYRFPFSVSERWLQCPNRTGFTGFSG